MNITVEALVEALHLVPHPEGGFYIESFRSQEFVDTNSFNRYDGERTVCTAMYYLLTEDTFSAMHRLKSEEVYHFYLGDPVEMLNLFPDGSSSTIPLGQDVLSGHLLQYHVPLGVWQGSRLVAGGALALLGTTVAPGFEFSDFEEGSRADLISQYPEERELIEALTRKL